MHNYSLRIVCCIKGKQCSERHTDPLPLAGKDIVSGPDDDDQGDKTARQMAKEELQDIAARIRMAHTVGTGNDAADIGNPAERKWTLLAHTTDPDRTVDWREETPLPPVHAASQIGDIMDEEFWPFCQDRFGKTSVSCASTQARTGRLATKMNPCPSGRKSRSGRT